MYLAVAAVSYVAGAITSSLVRYLLGKVCDHHG